MPLQNRVDPFGELFADLARGTFMGNRGGRFHTETRTLTARRWAARQWICCELAFKGRHREVWGRFYTELFFLDEPTALAAGHRPCFECRRQDAEGFAEHWRTACATARGRPRWTGYFIGNVCRAVPSAGTAGPSTVYRTALSSCWMTQRLPSVATRCCAGRRQAMPRLFHGPVVSRLTCSRRRRFWPCSLPAINRAGTRARSNLPLPSGEREFGQPRNAALMLSTEAPGARAALMMRASCLAKPSSAAAIASI
jgi:hypothetical protein